MDMRKFKVKERKKLWNRIGREDTQIIILKDADLMWILKA